MVSYRTCNIFIKHRLKWETSQFCVIELDQAIVILTTFPNLVHGITIAWSSLKLFKWYNMQQQAKACMHAATHSCTLTHMHIHNLIKSKYTCGCISNQM